MVTGLCVVQFCLWSYSWLTNRTLASLSSDFVNHSYDYRRNWSPLGSITFINHVDHGGNQHSSTEASLGIFRTRLPLPSFALKPVSVEVVDITSQLCGSVNVYRFYSHFVENLSISFIIHQISTYHALQVFEPTFLSR